MNSIKDWLNSGRDFNLGVTLYKLYGSDERLKKALDQGFSPFRLQKLIEAMIELLDRTETAEIIVPAPVEKTAEPVTPKRAPVLVGSVLMPENETPETKDPYREKWIKEYHRMNFLRHQLTELTDETSRGEMAFEILALERHCMFWWEAGKYTIRTGQPFQYDQEQETVVDPNALQRQLNNVRTNISKKKKVLERKPDDPELLAELQALLDKKKDLEIKLGKK